MIPYVPFGYSAYAPSIPVINTSKHMDWLGIASLGMQGINGIWNAISGNQNNKRQLDFARESQDKQMAFQREMFNLENEYNRPDHQMRRLIEAGINPVSAWSNGLSANTGNGQTSGQFTPGSPSTSPVPSPFSGMVGSSPFGLFKAKLDAEKVKADIGKTSSETKNIDKATEKLSLETALDDLKLQLEQQRSVYYGKQAYNEISKLINETSKAGQEAENLIYQGDLIQAEECLNQIMSKWYEVQKDYKQAQLPEALNDIKSVIAERRASASSSAAQAKFYTISSKDKLADFYRKIDDAFELYLDEHDNIKVDEDRLNELKQMALKEAKNAIRQQNQNYWNPFRYVGSVLGASGNVTKLVK